ncbi:OmpA family protein [Mixta mediterraneensis]|uniref:OmpA family protein n=1 Tax=Mixta mediterraneensis TaxID=2758443 RepID=UPI001877338B|nr:OmpA family protein [Mixta mediterraneensis]MBE5254246.1 OmpA family protein [Mixta mediterraneensis]
MQDEKKVNTKTVDPVVDQKIIKKDRPGWLLWLLPLLALLLLLIWFMQHHQNDSQTSSQTTNSIHPSAAANKAPDADSGSAVDKINAWFAGDKNAESGWITLDSVRFSSGSAELITDDSAQLEKIAGILNAHSEARVVIRGFADATGPQWLNENLSAERAGAVRAWLVSHHVNDDRLSIDGRGASAPVASNATELGREKNRRVALKIQPGN